MTPFINFFPIHPPTSGAAPTGKCVYCSSGCLATCASGKTSAECTALHNAGCGGDASPQWTEGATCGGPITINCGGI